MKKLILLSLMTLLCLPLTVYAAGIGGPPTGGQFKFNIGWDNEYNFNRDIKPSEVIVLIERDVIANCEIKNMYRSMLNISFGVFDFLDVYIKLGTADYKFKTDAIDQFGFPLGEARFNTKCGFAYGAGVKGAYGFKNGLLVGADVQYLRHSQRYRSTLTPLFGPEETMTGKMTTQEWQFGPFVGYKIMKFIPYVGVKYSDVRLRIRTDEDTYKFKAEDHFGTFVGLTYDILPQLKLNLEGRFIDETGLNLNVIFKF